MMKSPEEAKRFYQEKCEREYLESCDKRHQEYDESYKKSSLIKKRIIDEKPIETAMEIAKNAIEVNESTQHRLLEHIERRGNAYDIDIFRSVVTNKMKSEFIEHSYQNDRELFLEAIYKYWNSPSVTIDKGPFEGYILTAESFDYPQQQYNQVHFTYTKQFHLRLYKNVHFWYDPRTWFL